VRLEALRHRPLPPPEDLAEPVPLGVQHLEQLAPPREQRFEGLSLGVRQRAHGRPYPLAEQCQYTGVDAVSLRQLPGRPREVADLARVDYRHRQPGRREPRRGEELVPAGRLEHDQLGPERR